MNSEVVIAHEKRRDFGLSSQMWLKALPRRNYRREVSPYVMLLGRQQQDRG